MNYSSHPVSRLRGSYSPPGDKSVSHRALIAASMANGRSTITRLAPGDDVASTGDALKELGVEIRRDATSVVVSGRGPRAAGADIDARNSGTTMRLLAGVVAGGPGRFAFRGDESLSGRPMDRIAVPLRQMGAKVTLRDERFPPVVVDGGSLRGITYQPPVASAQVKGSVLFAGLQAEGPTTVMESHPSRDHTERLLEWLGVPMNIGSGRVELLEGDRLPLRNFELAVPGDFSSAAYFIAASLLVKDSDVRIDSVGLNASRTGFLDVLDAMGASVVVEATSQEPEPIGNLRVRYSELKAVTISGSLVPRMIDELLLVALLATRAEGTTEIRDASELRVKETDRITVLAAGLRELGAKVEELADGLVIEGPTKLRGGKVTSAGDHRLALTFAVAGLAASEGVIIDRWESTSISYPGFDENLAALVAS